MGTAKIMIVEDNFTVAADCQDCLSNLGYNVTSIQASGEDSILKVETEMPDAVLMDIHLRDKMDGIQTAEHIYNKFQIPVVFLSAYGDSELLQRAKKVGSFGYLIKPFKEDELYATLEMALYKSQIEKKHKQMEAQIQRLQKMESIGTLAGGLAHDFNNLLYVVLGNISLAQEDLNLEIETSESLKEAEKACIKAKKLTARLITFSKGGDPVKKMMSINGLLKDTVISILSESNITPKISIADDIRQVNIDEGQIKQVVQNIVVNAKESMDDNGQLTVSCKNIDIAEESNLPLSPGEYIKISFEDHGCGISKENLEKIYDPYFSTKDMGTDKGQGLGLAICYSIIQKHGGLISVESEPQTRSTFSVYLPAFLVKEPDLQKSEEKPVAQKPVKQPATGTKKILLMDDEEMIRSFISKVINRLGYDVETCPEGKEAVEIYTKAMESKEPFDMVILDLTNKIGMGGQATMKRLLKINPDVKGIIITGYSNDPVVADFRAYG
ncbi:MAG: response regulator, partial [Thermodesulfobacteriota bacterium]|nr:response regulator [Thermodesulfobacteriota bacterium]